MTCKELQEEELEVLRSIYDGDERFKETSVTTFQYMVGNQGDTKSFLLEINWGDTYPNAQPSISLDTFYNKFIVQEVKDHIISRLEDEAEIQLGTPMTYTLLEWAKENVEELMVGQPEKTETIDNEIRTDDMSSENTQATGAIKKEKKVQLTKQQKRKLADKVDSKGERPRGWNWVDVIKHLSQTGLKGNKDISPESSNS